VFPSLGDGSQIPTLFGLLGKDRLNHLELELEFFLRPTVSRPVSLGIGPPFGTFDQILSCSSLFVWQLRYSSFKAPSLTRKRVCSLQCNHSLVRSLTPNNHTLPSHLKLCSIFVDSYDSQGLRREITRKCAVKTVMKHAQSGTTVQMEVKIYAINLPGKTDHLRLKPINIYQEFVVILDFKISDDVRSLETQWLWMLYTIVRTLYHLL
jgi:hypothetical protein